METEVLENLGLSRTEANVYLSLLELGSAAANKISERTGIHRRTVYDALETLIEKGVVSFIVEGSTKKYLAETPEVFIDILDNKKREFTAVLPKLLEKKRTVASTSEVTIYRGKKAIKPAFEDLLKSKQDLYMFGSGGKFQTLFGELYKTQWMNKVKDSGISLKAIFSSKAKSTIGSFPNTEFKFIKDEYSLPVSTVIYGNKVQIMLFSEQPIGIIITSKEIANAFLKYFELLWKRIKP